VPGFVVRDEIDELFGAANPNPTRGGCPSTDTIRALARRERPIDDAAYEHLGFCSPCYQEFRALQESPAATLDKKSARRWPWLAVAAALLLAVTGAWLYMRDRGTAPAPSEATVQVARVEVDLRPFAVAREPQGPGSRPAPSLPRGRVELTVLLPAGSEPGAYEAELRDAGGAVVASTAGHADIRDFVTTLGLTLDLRAVSPGDHQLAIRREGEGWHVFPVVIR
jgi:hypothetical protein